VNAIFAAALDSVSDQIRDEGIHLAFLAFVGGASCVSGLIGWLLRNDLKRRDEERAKILLSISVLDETLDKLDHRHGCEIGDIKIAVAPLFTKAGIDQPNYPTR
jgi:hypothetical protein